jgi:hypothetical protein
VGGLVNSLPHQQLRGGQCFGSAEPLRGSRERSQRLREYEMDRTWPAADPTAPRANHWMGHHCSRKRSPPRNQTSRSLAESPATQRRD